MKKNKIVIIVLILGILFLTSYLYNSYATSTGVSLGNDENTYDILLNDSTDTVTVPAKSSKTVYYQFSNTNKGTIKYHIGYISNNVIAKVWWDSEDFVSGTIDQGVTKFIKLKLINESTEDDTITIKPVLGYVNGGDVIPDSNTTLVTGTINETNTMSITPSTALSTLGIEKTAVEEISFVNNNIVPTNALGSTNMNNDGSIKMWYTASDNENMYKLYIGSDNGITTFPGNCGDMFSGYSKVIIINIKYINTSNVISMGRMFSSCSSLINLDLSNFDTSNVKYMTVTNSSLGGIFTGCSNLIRLDLSNWNTSNVIDMWYMFANCTKLKTLNINNWDTSNVTRMANMFEGCSSLTSLDLSSFNTNKISSMAKMFTNCSSLTFLDISSFDTSNVTSMASLFSGCSKLKTLNLTNFNTINVKDMSNMFNGCSSLGNLDLGSFNTSNVTTMLQMFNKCSNLLELNLSNFNTINVTDMREMFLGCTKLKKLDVSSFNTSNVTKMNSGGSWQGMFNGCSSLESLDLSSFDISGITNMAYMFAGCSKIKFLNMSNADLSNITSSEGMLSKVPTTVIIYLKDTQGNRDFMSNNFSTYTNVQYIPSE